MHIETTTALTPDRRVRAKSPTSVKALSQANARTKPFIGWDGEGYTVAGNHHYALFGNSDGLRISGRLDWRTCLPLLFNAPRNAHHVIFAGTYDCVMMFRHHPEIDRLLHGQPVYMDQYRVTFLKGKMLRVTDRERGETRILYDVFTFFGTSFVKACQEYLGGSDMLDQIEAMKLQRNTFTKDDVLSGGVEGYMTQELTLLVDLCNSLRSRLAAVGIHPSQWHGPGAVASAVFKREHVKEHKGSYPDEFRRIAESAYYGGRFEQFQRGTFLGTVYQYDIRSAYPAAMRSLPSLEGATWEHTTNIGCGISRYDLCYIDCYTSSPIGYLPHRCKDGTIYYPKFVKGWYWGVEIPDDYHHYITESYRFHPGSSVKPFAYIDGMYAQRAQLKADRKPEQLALKLALNSGYGKLAQSKGARCDPDTGWKYPTFHEVVWAGLITAITRRSISDALHSVDSADIIATETDSVFTLAPISLRVGSNLGMWDCETLDGIKYIQSGVSLVLSDSTWKFKTRGFTVKRTDDENAIWSRFLEVSPHQLDLKQTRFGTDPRQRERFGQWYETIHHLTLDVNDNEKRVHDPSCHECLSGHTYADSLHPLVVPDIPVQDSTPYKFVWNDGAVTSDPVFGWDNDPQLRMEYMQ